MIQGYFKIGDDYNTRDCGHSFIFFKIYSFIITVGKEKLMKKKGRFAMINWDFDQFKKTQQKHKATYIGSDKEQKTGVNDPSYNNEHDTDKAVGATGREVLGEE